MLSPVTALTGILPAIGAIALTVKGLRRMAARRASGPATLMQMPREPVPTGTPAAARSAANADTGETLVTPRRSAEQRAQVIRTTALHWLLFLAIMSALIGGGVLFSR